MISVLTLACGWGFLDNTTTCEPRGTSETKPGKVRNTDISSLPARVPPARLKASPTASPKRETYACPRLECHGRPAPRPYPCIAHPFQLSLSYDDCRNCTHYSYEQIRRSYKWPATPDTALHFHGRPPDTNCHKPSAQNMQFSFALLYRLQAASARTIPEPHVGPRPRPGQ